MSGLRLASSATSAAHASATGAPRRPNRRLTPTRWSASTSRRTDGTPAAAVTAAATSSAARGEAQPAERWWRRGRGGRQQRRHRRTPKARVAERDVRRGGRQQRGGGGEVQPAARGDVATANGERPPRESGTAARHSVDAAGHALAATATAAADAAACGRTHRSAGEGRQSARPHDRRDRVGPRAERRRQQLQDEGALAICERHGDRGSLGGGARRRRLDVQAVYVEHRRARGEEDQVAQPRLDRSEAAEDPRAVGRRGARRW